MELQTGENWFQKGYTRHGPHDPLPTLQQGGGNPSYLRETGSTVSRDSERESWSEGTVAVEVQSETWDQERGSRGDTEEFQC